MQMAFFRRLSAIMKSVMFRRFAKLLSPVTLVAYLIATTWATSPHTHEHALLDHDRAACHDADACEHHCHVHHHHGHTHVHTHSHPVATNTETCHRPVTPCPGHGHHEEDNCAACKLLSAKSLASPQVTVIVLTE